MKDANMVDMKDMQMMKDKMKDMENMSDEMKWDSGYRYKFLGKMIRSNRIIRMGLVFVLSLCLIAGLCMVVTAEEQAPEELTVQDITIEKDPEFGAIYLHLTNDDMHNLGFQFGDSITLSFSNGCTFENIPYFSGYYVPVGNVLICGYHSYPYVAVARNYSASIWDEINADEDTLASLTLVKSGEYQIT